MILDKLYQISKKSSRQRKQRKTIEFPKKGSRHKVSKKGLRGKKRSGSRYDRVLGRIRMYGKKVDSKIAKC